CWGGAMTCRCRVASWSARGRALLPSFVESRVGGPMTARSQVTLGALLAAASSAIACFLPGEPSGAGRVTFVLDFAQPYRVPLAGAAQPSVKITADGQALSDPNYHFESLDPAVVHVDPTGRGLEGVA